MRINKYEVRRTKLCLKTAMKGSGVNCGYGDALWKSSIAIDSRPPRGDLFPGICTLPARLPPLPIDDVLGDVVGHLKTSSATVLKAPPGAGKTTRVPPAMLDAGLAATGKILVLQPRRVAARA